MEISKVAYCGLNCEECPVWVASRNNDQDLKIKTAREWSRLYAGELSQELTPDDVQCGGCRSRGTAVFLGCRVCPIRDCCNKKKFLSCAGCPGYDSCEFLNGFFVIHPQAKERLDAIRNKTGQYD